MQTAIRQAKLDERIFKVGACIVKNGEILIETHGLIESGQHAEFTAIDTCEKQGKNLKGATLYTTLEPCIHVRSQRNIDCAVKIVKSGIAEVVVGMLDPDSRVCSRGWNYLKQNGIRVHRFPLTLINEIEDISIDFITEKATETDVNKIYRSLIFTDDQKGKSRPVIGFSGDIIPDLPDIRNLSRMYDRGQLMIPRILWPSANNELWGNVLKQRQQILENIRTGVVEPKLGKVYFNWICAFLGDAWKIRTEAAARIPKMWRGMALYWKNFRRNSFENALNNYLILCNTNILLMLARVEKSKSKALFSPARKWVHMAEAKNHTLSDVLKEVFNHPSPFYQVEIYKLGNWCPYREKYVYVPKPDAIKMGRTINQIDHISSSYIVPGVEYSLIGEQIIVEYGLGKWKKILDDYGYEI